MEQNLTAHTLPRADLGRSRVVLRLLAFASLSIIEVFITSFAFNFPTALADWGNPVAYAKMLAQAGLVAFAVLAILMWPDRAAIQRAWDRACEVGNLRASVLANL